MRKRFDLRLLAVVPAAISLFMGYGSFPANAGETITIEKTYESKKPDEETNHFTNIYSENGKQYKLAGIESEVMESRPEVEEQQRTIDQDGFYFEDEALTNLPLEEIEQDGITYYLINSELIASTTESRIQYGTTTIEYKGLEYIDELPEQGDVTIFDGITGKQYERELPRTEYRVVAEHWEPEFSFPVTIYSVDADFYMLGDKEISRGTDLSQYEADFLNLLGLSPDYYQVNDVVMQGEPYEQEGELVQDAIAYGEKRVVDVEATFAGNVKIPSEPYWYYRCTYSNIQDEEIETIYTIRAIATYVEEEVVQTAAEAPSFWNKLIEFISNPITVAVLLILVFIVMCLMLIKRKKKKDKVAVTYINDSEK